MLNMSINNKNSTGINAAKLYYTGKRMDFFDPILLDSITASIAGVFNFNAPVTDLTEGHHFF